MLDWGGAGYISKASAEGKQPPASLLSLPYRLIPSASEMSQSEEVFQCAIVYPDPSKVDKVCIHYKFAAVGQSGCNSHPTLLNQRWQRCTAQRHHERHSCVGQGERAKYVTVPGLLLCQSGWWANYHGLGDVSSPDVDFFLPILQGSRNTIRFSEPQHSFLADSS